MRGIIMLLGQVKFEPMSSNPSCLLIDTFVIMTLLSIINNSVMMNIIRVVDPCRGESLQVNGSGNCHHPGF